MMGRAYPDRVKAQIHRHLLSLKRNGSKFFSFFYLLLLLYNIYINNPHLPDNLSRTPPHPAPFSFRWKKKKKKKKVVSLEEEEGETLDLISDDGAIVVGR